MVVRSADGQFGDVDAGTKRNFSRLTNELDPGTYRFPAAQHQPCKSLWFGISIRYSSMVSCARNEELRLCMMCIPKNDEPRSTDYMGTSAVTSSVAKHTCVNSQSNMLVILRNCLMQQRRKKGAFSYLPLLYNHGPGTSPSRSLTSASTHHLNSNSPFHPTR